MSNWTEQCHRSSRFLRRRKSDCWTGPTACATGIVRGSTSADVTRDLAQHLRLSSNPGVMGIYWSEGKSEIKPERRTVAKKQGDIHRWRNSRNLLQVNVTKTKHCHHPRSSHRDLLGQDKAAAKPARRLLFKTTMAQPSSTETGLYTEDDTCDSQAANWN